MAAGDDGDGPPSRRDGIARLFYNFGVTAHSRRSGGKSHQLQGVQHHGDGRDASE